MNQTYKLRKLKLVFLGESNVGKSSLITRFIYDSFEDGYVSTTGIDFLSKTIHLDTRTIRLQLWDTAGQERFKSLIPNYVRDCDHAIIVYDISNEDSFIEVTKWCEFVRNLRGENFPITLVANKIDLDEETKRKVTTREGETKSKKLNIKFIETSAKTAQNVNSLFKTIAINSFNINDETKQNLNQEFNVILSNSDEENNPKFYSNCCNL